MKRKLLSAAAAAASIAALATAYAAHDGDENDTAILAQARVGITQAIAAAEHHAGGKAVRAELENENGAAVYAVEVVDGTNSTDVKVDAGDGRILSAQAERGHDGADQEDESEHDGERGER